MLPPDYTTATLQAADADSERAVEDPVLALLADPQSHPEAREGDAWLLGLSVEQLLARRIAEAVAALRT